MTVKDENDDKDAGGGVREAINAAIEEHDVDFSADAGFDEAADVEAAPEIKDTGDPAEGDETPVGDKAPDPVAAKEGDTLGEEEPKPAEAKGDKAPVGWGAEAREAWADLPDVVKAQVSARNKQVDQMLNDGAQNRKTGESLNALATAYQPVMAAEGVQNPLEAVKGLFDTVAQLRMGSPEQRAQKMAGLINHYGIDIKALDTALTAGMDPVSGAPAGGMDPALQQRLGSLEQRLQQQDAFAAAQQDAQIGGEIDAFAPTAEFFEDVKLTMADFLDVAAENNVAMPLQEAYDKACAMTPSVAAVLKQRTDTAALTGNRDTIAAKRRAGVSIVPDVGATSAGDTAAQGGRPSLRETITEAFEEHT